MDRVTVTVTVDTEEDDWGSYRRTGNTTRNIGRLPELQDLFERHGVRPTYLVNSPPLKDAKSVRILGRLSERTGVEMGAQCHPWNTPPFDPRHGGKAGSMMSALPLDVNRKKVETVRRTMIAELGVRPTSFRAGRWAFGENVAPALDELGFEVDASVTPFLDWTDEGGPDYSGAPHVPYRFDPADPLRPDPDGSMVELPATVGFLRGDFGRSSRLRRCLESSILAKLRVVGALDRLGFLRRRWLSPEFSSREELVRLAEACVSTGQRVIALTFHSPSLLPGSTPFVRDSHDLERFLGDIESFLRYCVERGWTFGTLGQVGERVAATPLRDSVPRVET